MLARHPLFQLLDSSEYRGYPFFYDNTHQARGMPGVAENMRRKFPSLVIKIKFLKNLLCSGSHEDWAGGPGTIPPPRYKMYHCARPGKVEASAEAAEGVKRSLMSTSTAVQSNNLAGESQSFAQQFQAFDMIAIDKNRVFPGDQLNEPGQVVEFEQGGRFAVRHSGMPGGFEDTSATEQEPLPVEIEFSGGQGPAGDEFGIDSAPQAIAFDFIGYRPNRLITTQAPAGHFREITTDIAAMRQRAMLGQRLRA
jgi:hypothetical protein